MDICLVAVCGEMNEPWVHFKLKNGSRHFEVPRILALGLSRGKKWKKVFVDMFGLSQNDPELVPNVGLAEVNASSGFSAACKTAAAVCCDRGHG